MSRYVVSRFCRTKQLAASYDMCVSFGPFLLLNGHQNLQDQLVYMKGLIMTHVKKPMSRDQVNSQCFMHVKESLMQLTRFCGAAALPFRCWYFSNKSLFGALNPHTLEL